MAEIAIRRRVLQLAYRLGQVRNPPSPAAGPESRARLVTLQYDGGDELALWWTDCRTTIFCKVRVTPRDRTRWTVSVLASILGNRSSTTRSRPGKSVDDDETSPKEAVDFDLTFALKYLPVIMKTNNSLEPEEAVTVFDGRPPVTLSVDLKNVYITQEGEERATVALEWKKVRVALQGRLERDFQVAAMRAERGQRAKLAIRPLRKVLRFLARGPRGQDPEDRTKTSTFFEDGLAMAASSIPRGNAVVLVAKGPRLPFAVTLHKSEVLVISRWLRVVRKDLGKNATEVEVTELTDSDRPRYGFADPTRKHCLWVPAVARPFLRAVIDPTLAITPRFAVQVNRRTLSTNAKLFGHQAHRRKVLCAVWQDETGVCRLSIRSNSGQTSPAADTLDAVLHVAPGASFAPWAFVADARDLLAALAAFSHKDILLVSRPPAQGHPFAGQPDLGWKWLEVRPATKSADAIWTTIGRRAFVLITPSPPPSMAGQEPSSGAAQGG